MGVLERKRFGENSAGERSLGENVRHVGNDASGPWVEAVSAPSSTRKRVGRSHLRRTKREGNPVQARGWVRESDDCARGSDRLQKSASGAGLVDDERIARQRPM